MNKSNFGNYIKEKRTELGLTQKELADRLIVDATSVSKWERGISYPDITMIPDLCRHLQINEHELIASSNDTEYRRTQTDARRYRTIKNVLFWSFSIGYFVAVLTCFIVNLAVEHTLSWFYLVFAGCLCGFTYFPTCLRFFQKGKLAVFIVSTYASLFLLFLTCCLYTGGTWVWIASVSTLLGYFALFYPIVFTRQKVYLHEETYRSLSRAFWITYAVGLFVLTCAVLLLTVPNPNVALAIAGYSFSILFVIGAVEWLPLRRTKKLALDFVFGGAYVFGMNPVLHTLLEDNATDYLRVNFLDWNTCSNGNTAVLVLVACLIASTVLMLVPQKKK